MPSPERPPVYRFDRLVLFFGLAIAAATLLYWTMLEFERFGQWTGEGVLRAAIVLGAVGLLSIVLRLGQWVESRRRP